jgi:hypothetical protein
LSRGFNRIGDGNATSTFRGPGDQSLVMVPGLGPLARNGGPTQTIHAVLKDGPAPQATGPQAAVLAQTSAANAVPRAATARGPPEVRRVGAFEKKAVRQKGPCRLGGTGKRAANACIPLTARRLRYVFLEPVSLGNGSRQAPEARSSKADPETR